MVVIRSGDQVEPGTASASARLHSHRLHRPGAPDRAVGHWFWGALSLAMGLYLAGSGWVAWSGGAVVILAGLIGAISHRRWATVLLWVGLGFTLGVVLHLVITLGNPDSPGLIPLS